MERDNGEKLDSLIAEVVKVSAVMSDISKEVHSVNNRMIGIETVLNGINGNGGIVMDLKNMGEKLSKQGTSLSSLQRDIDVLNNDHVNVKAEVKDHDRKIDELSTNSAKVSTKVAFMVTAISSAAALIMSLLLKYLQVK